MSKIEQLDKLDREIKNAEISLKSIRLNVEQIDKEISVLSPRKNELEQNIEFHKKADTVPIAHEYKKVKAELAKIKARLILISSDQKRAIQACKDIEQVIDRFKREHLELIKTSENNVLKPIFGGKRGQK